MVVILPLRAVTVAQESDLVMDPNQVLQLLIVFRSMMEISPQQAIMVQESDLGMEILGLLVLKVFAFIVAISMQQDLLLLESDLGVESMVELQVLEIFALRMVLSPLQDILTVQESDLGVETRVIQPLRTSLFSMA
jgi:hypothetical protein